jgi:hypothetical protein
MWRRTTQIFMNTQAVNREKTQYNSSHQKNNNKKIKKSSHTFLPPEPKENNQLNSHIYCPRHKK